MADSDVLNRRGIGPKRNTVMKTEFDFVPQFLGDEVAHQPQGGRDSTAQGSLAGSQGSRLGLSNLAPVGLSC